jgi:para-nitrobenzyl esterase
LKDNIQHFGGDNTRVTIAGESAGAWSVSALLASPLATGLFHGAIMQSTYSGLLFYPQAKAVAQTGALCEEKHCKGKSDKLACLRKLSADDAWGCNPQSLLDPSPDKFSIIGGLTAPNVDGYVLPCDPLTALRDKTGKCGKINRVPVMIGSQLREENMFSEYFLPPNSEVAGINTDLKLTTDVMKNIPSEYSSLFTAQANTTRTMTAAQVKSCDIHS